MVEGFVCQCGKEHADTDPTGKDLSVHVNFDELDCFNQKESVKIKRVVRCFEEKLLHDTNTEIGTESDYGPDLVVFLPFQGEMRIKSICVIGGFDGAAPSKMKLYKNENNVDANICEEKKPVQVIDLADNQDGIDYPVSLSKFTNVSNLVLGFTDNFGTDTTQIKFIGIKGELLRAKPKMGAISYEVRANYSKFETPEDLNHAANLGL